MAIKNIIVHEVKKDAEDEAASLSLRNDENIIDGHAEELSENLSALFQRTGLSTGQFSEPKHTDDPIPQFVNLLIKYLEEEEFTDFVTFTQSAARGFKKELDRANSSKGGYLWFNHYVFKNEHFLSVVLLRKKQGLSLSDDLSLAEIEQIDMDKLHMAARINLTAWGKGESQRYIAFRVGRDAKGVTDYFANFIGCEEYTQARADTKNLVAVTKIYCQHNYFDEGQTENVKEFVFESCEAWLSNDSPVYLESLSTMLDERFVPENKGVFLDIAQSEPYCLSNEMALDKSSLRGLVRYSGNTKKMNVSFDSDLLNKTVFYNSAKGELIINDLPPKLIAQLTKKDT